MGAPRGAPTFRRESGELPIADRRREDGAGLRLQAAFFLLNSPILAVTSFTAVVKPA